LSDEDKAYNIETVQKYKEGKVLVIMPDEQSGDNITVSRMVAPFFVDVYPEGSNELATFRFVIPQQRGESVFPDRDTVTVIVSGQQSVINRITEKDVLVLADLSDPAYEVAGEHTVMLRAVLNSAGGNLRISSIEPEKIQIKCVVHKENK
jgi:virulence-associated protein VagC